jgi:hypothetical protein
MALAQKGRRERGLKIYKEMGWGTNQDLKDLDEDLWALTTDFVFGEVWSRSGQREWICIYDMRIRSVFPTIKSRN